MSRNAARLDRLLKNIDTSKLGIEIAPYHNAAIPKSEGNNVRIVDVFDTETLRKHASNDPLIPDDQAASIEEVDLVGDACQIAQLCERAGLTGQVHYVVSSHNFEHLPNPIKFLQGVCAVLAPGGVLSMAIPECRAIFDHFRMQTRLADWLLAYHDDVQQPSPELIFDQVANAALYFQHGDKDPSITMNFGRGNPELFRPVGDVRAAYASYLAAKENPKGYQDTHCSVVSNISFELMVLELIYLGLLDLDILEVAESSGHEFFAHLIKPPVFQPMDEATFKKRREALLIRLSRSLGKSGHPTPPFHYRAVQYLRPRFRALFGENTYRKIRAWNRRRLGKTPPE